MGVVYAAYDPKLERKVAIKMLHEDISESHGARLEREARAMARLAHPNVVGVHEVGDFGNRLFIAMEFVDGTTLRDWLREDKPTLKQILLTMVAVGKGLAAAHAANMVHRDFKPDNVLIGRDGRARVSDFGLVTATGSANTGEPAPLSSLRGPDGKVLTGTGAVMGTPPYMAPEQHIGGVADHRADQFSFCVTLWEALYEQRPFDASTYDELVDNVTAGRMSEPPRPSTVPTWLRTILKRGLSTNPNDRYSSMDALLQQIERDRRSYRVRAVIVVGLVAAMGPTVWAIQHESAASSRPCQDAHEKLSGTWNKEVRSTIRRAFEDTGVVYASDVWETVRDSLDSRSAEWVSTRTKACEATRVHGTQSTELMHQRIICYDRLPHEMTALTTKLADANAEVVNHAAETAISLTELDRGNAPSPVSFRIAAGSFYAAILSSSRS